MKLKFLAVLISLLFLPAFSAEWFELDNKTYIDLSTMQVNNQTGIVKFWMKNLRENAKDTYDGKPYWYKMQLYSIDCKNRKIGIHHSTVYGLKNELIDNYDYYVSSFSQNWNEILPETNGEYWYDSVCRY